MVPQPGALPEIFKRVGVVPQGNGWLTVRFIGSPVTHIMLDLVTPLGRIIPKPGMLPEIEWGGSPRTDGTVRFGSPAILNPDNLQKKIIGVLLF